MPKKAPIPHSQIRFSSETRRLIKAALAEDAGAEDVTSVLITPAGAKGVAEIISREKGILCGAPVIEQLFLEADPRAKFEFFCRDGEAIRKNQRIVTVHGNVRALLKAERTVLNFLGKMSAVATKTNSFVKAVKKYQVLILDTRKTTPLWREIEKYAVRMGGGKNHRMGLYDAVLVKENHRPHGNLKKLAAYEGAFEIEIRNAQELREALQYRPRVVLFDNFTPNRLRQAVQIARKKSPETILEASGGITLENVAHYAAMGVDWISVGALTHSPKCFDFSLYILAEGARAHVEDGRPACSSI